MQVEQLSQISARHRLMQALELLSLRSHLSYRLVNGDAWIRLVEVWKQHGAPSQDVVNSIQDLQLDPVNLRTNVDPKRWNWIYPLWNPDQMDVDSRRAAERLEDEISHSIWKTRHSLGNPLHESLLLAYPFFRVLTRLQTLKAVYDLAQSNDANSVKILRNPTGLSRGLKKLHHHETLGITEGDVMVVGAVWLDDLVGGHPLEEAGSPKQALLTDVLTAETIRSGRRLAEEVYEGNTRKRIASDFEALANLLTVANMHPVLSRTVLEKRVQNLGDTLEVLDSVYLKYARNLGDMRAAEWQAVIEFISFFLDDVTETLVRGRIEDIRRSILQVDETMLLRRRLSRRKERGNHILVSWNLSKDLTISDPYEKWKDLIEIREIREDPTSSFDRPIVCSCSSQEISDIIQNYFRDFISHNVVSRYTFQHYEHEKLKFKMRYLKADDLEERYRLISNSVRTMVLADKVILLEYDGPSNALIPVVLFRDRILQKDSLTEEKELKRAKAELTVALKKASSNIDFNRAQSSSYRALDQVHLLSRFEGEDLNPLASRIMDKVDTLSKELSDYFKDEEDVLAIPIMFYGRKQGVLHLSTVLPYQFKSEDRINLIRAVQLFEEEIFQARFIRALDRVHALLSKGIQQKIRSEDFLRGIAGELARILGARGVSIWWKDSSDRNSLKLVSLEGDIMRENINLGVWVSLVQDNFFRDLIEKDIAIVSDLEGRGFWGAAIAEIGLMGCIQASMKDDDGNILGAIVIHDVDIVELTQPFTEELLFLVREVQRILLYFYLHHGQIEHIQLRIGHDIESSLLRIFQSAQEVSKFKPFLGVSSHERDNFGKAVDDILENSTNASDVLEKLTEGRLPREIKVGEDDPLLPFYFHFDSDKEPVNPIDLYDAIKKSVLSKKKMFRDKPMKYILHRPLDFEVRIEGAVVDMILNNMVDNVLKYGKTYGEFEISLCRMPAHLEIIMMNEGIRLDQESRKNTELVFQRSRQCYETTGQKIPGSGLGLYNAQILARAFGGDLWLAYGDASPWAKFEFHLSIPLWWCEKELFASKLSKGDPQ